MYHSQWAWSWWQGEKWGPYMGPRGKFISDQDKNNVLSKQICHLRDKATIKLDIWDTLWLIKGRPYSVFFKCYCLSESLTSIRWWFLGTLCPTYMDIFIKSVFSPYRVYQKKRKIQLKGRKIEIYDWYQY